MKRIKHPGDPGAVALPGGGGHTPEPRRTIPRPRRDDPPSGWKGQARDRHNLGRSDPSPSHVTRRRPPSTKVTARTAEGPGDVAGEVDDPHPAVAEFAEHLTPALPQAFSQTEADSDRRRASWIRDCPWEVRRSVAVFNHAAILRPLELSSSVQIARPIADRGAPGLTHIRPRGLRKKNRPAPGRRTLPCPRRWRLARRRRSGQHSPRLRRNARGLAAQLLVLLR